LVLCSKFTKKRVLSEPGQPGSDRTRCESLQRSLDPQLDHGGREGKGDGRAGEEGREKGGELEGWERDGRE